MNKTSLAIISSALAVALTACPGTGTNGGKNGGDNGGNNGGTYARLGTVAISDTTMGSSSTASAFGTFMQLDTPLTVVPSQPYGATDQCVVSSGTTTPIPGVDPGAVTTLDAGAALTLRRGTTTYTTLAKTSADGFITYTGSPAAPIPADLTLDVPGAAFPAFTGVSFPAMPAAFTLTASTGLDAIDKTTTFTWDAGSSGSVMLLSGSGTGANDATVAFTCVAADDGSFAFPAATQSDLDARGFTTGRLSMATRSASHAETIGDAILFLQSTRSTFFLAPGAARSR